MPSGHKSHCGPASDFDYFFAMEIMAGNKLVIKFEKMHHASIWISKGIMINPIHSQSKISVSYKNTHNEVGKALVCYKYLPALALALNFCKKLLSRSHSKHFERRSILRSF